MEHINPPNKDLRLKIFKITTRLYKWIFPHPRGFPVVKSCSLYEYTDKGSTMDADRGFSYSSKKHSLLTNNETRVSGFFWMGTFLFLSKVNGIIQWNEKNP